MILSDSTLKTMIDSGELGIEPIGDEQIQPASIDVRLGNHFLKVNENKLDVIRLDAEIQYEELNQEQIIIPPHSFLLATTCEYIRLPADVTAFVEGRSSIGRIGLFIQNAGWVDPSVPSLTEELVGLELDGRGESFVRVDADHALAVGEQQGLATTGW